MFLLYWYLTYPLEYLYSCWPLPVDSPLVVGLTAVSVSVSPYMERVREKRLRSASLALVSTAREEGLRH